MIVRLLYYNNQARIRVILIIFVQLKVVRNTF